MIQTLSGNRYIKIGFITTMSVLLIGLWAELAGAVFLMRYGYDFNETSPFKMLRYLLYYRGNAGVTDWMGISSFLAFIILLLPALFFFIPVKKSLFGDARFATRNEIQKTGLLAGKGIVVGKYGQKYLTFGGEQHVIVSAPTRSGKGVGIVIPNLLTWPESVVVLDIKQENFDITSKYREKYGQKCYLFNPTASDYRTHRYNPLSYVSDDPVFRVDEIQKIASMLFPDSHRESAIWTATPRTLFLGIVLYLIETPGRPVTLGQVLRETLAHGDGAEYFKKVIEEREKTNPLSSTCKINLNGYAGIDAKATRDGIITNFRAGLELWMNPLVDAATSGNDFDFRDLRRKKMSIYLGISPNNLTRLTPLINLFFSQLLDQNTRELPYQNKEIKHSCLLLKDEFASIGKISVLSKGIAYIAGYQLRMLTILQSPSQLVEVYGKEGSQTFQTNHALSLVYPPKASDTQTAKEISEWLGYQTVKAKSDHRRKLALTRKHDSTNHSDQRRALLLPQEISSLGKKRELIVIEDTPPILAKKIYYYKEPVFLDRLKEVSPSLAKLGSKIPNKIQFDKAVQAGELRASIPLIDIQAHFKTVENAPGIKFESKNKRLIRGVEDGDIPNLEKMTKRDFHVNLDAVKKPSGPHADKASLEQYADDCCRHMGIDIIPSIQGEV